MYHNMTPTYGYLATPIGEATKLAVDTRASHWGVYVCTPMGAGTSTEVIDAAEGKTAAAGLWKTHTRMSVSVQRNKTKFLLCLLCISCKWDP